MTEPKTIQQTKDEVLGVLTRQAFLKLVARAVPTGVQLDPLRLVYQAFHVICTPDQKTGEFRLLACSYASIARAVLKAATVGLEFSGQAYLIPYGAECTFQSSVWGELAIVERTGKLEKAWAEVVYESEKIAGDFEIVVGDDPKLVHRLTEHVHKPGANLPIGDTKAIVKTSDGGRGAPLLAYACAKLKSGAVVWDYMLEAEMARARSASKSKDSPAHTQWGDEMRSKMATRRASKRWPHAAEVLAQLVNAEDPASVVIDAKGTAISSDELANAVGEDTAQPVPALGSRTPSAAEQLGIKPGGASTADRLAAELRERTQAKPVAAPAAPPSEPAQREPGED